MKTSVRINLESISFHDSFINIGTRDFADLRGADGRWSRNFTDDKKPKYYIFTFSRPIKERKKLLLLAKNKIGNLEQMPGFRLSWQYSEQLDNSPCHSYDPETKEFVR